MQIYKCVLFDLDGTLTDPFEGITNSIVYALKKFGIEVEDKRTLTDFIGPPLVNSFGQFYGFSRRDAAKAVEYYREYFAEKGIFENRLYDGVIPLLEELKGRGKRLIMATSKPQAFAEKIANYFKIERYFEHISGATLDSSKVEKADIIKFAFERYKIDNAIMVGDRKYDVLGAKANDLPSIGVLYGYGTREELVSAGATFLANSPQDMLQILK